jgi:DNA-binding transcriptional LysR family regulator
MNIAAIKAFVTATEENSFSEAAEKLHLTQPGISKRIGSLENHLNCQLFDRIGRGIFLTQAGRTFLPHAYAILQGAQSGITAVKNLSNQVQGELRVATTQHIGLHHLKDKVGNYVQAYPQVDFSLDFVHSRQAYIDVLKGKLELAIITEPSKIDPELSFTDVYFEQLKFVCNHQHPLAQITQPTLQQMSLYPAVLPDNESYTRRTIDALFQERQLSINASVPSNYLEALKVLVSAGLGWSVLPQGLIDESLHQLPIKDITLGRKIGYLVHKSRSLSNAGEAFLSAIKM